MDETQPEGSTIAAELKIDVTLIGKLNSADFQNAVSLFRNLWLVNEIDQMHEQVELILTSDPPFLKPRRWRIDALAARSRYPIRDLDLNLDGGLLVRDRPIARPGGTAPLPCQADYRIETVPYS